MAANALPTGWEMQYNQENKRYFFIDHVNKVTTWKDPRTPQHNPPASSPKPPTTSTTTAVGSNASAIAANISQTAKTTAVVGQGENFSIKLPTKSSATTSPTTSATTAVRNNATTSGPSKTTAVGGQGGNLNIQRPGYNPGATTSKTTNGAYQMTTTPSKTTGVGGQTVPISIGLEKTAGSTPKTSNLNVNYASDGKSGASQKTALVSSLRNSNKDGRNEMIAMRDLSKSPKNKALTTNETASFISKNFGLETKFIRDDLSDNEDDLLSVEFVQGRFPNVDSVIVQQVVSGSATYFDATMKLVDMGFKETTSKNYPDMLNIAKAALKEKNAEKICKTTTASTPVNIVNHHFAVDDIKSSSVTNIPVQLEKVFSLNKMERCQTATPTPIKTYARHEFAVNDVLDTKDIPKIGDIYKVKSDTAIAIPASKKVQEMKKENIEPINTVSKSIKKRTMEPPSYKTLYVSLARGADGSLSAGPNKNLISGPQKWHHEIQAIGHDRSLCNGPVQGLAKGSMHRKRNISAVI